MAMSRHIDKNEGVTGLNDDRQTRKIYWWHMPIGEDDNVPAGKYMILTLAVWFGLALVVAVVVGLVFAN